MIKAFILLANILLPITAFALAIVNEETPYRWLFPVAITTHVVIRMWETFYTSKEKQPQKFEGDWTLAVGTMAYIAMLYVVTLEFYYTDREFQQSWFIAGLLLYSVATRLRWWGATTLGSQWAIHVVGKQKTNKTRLLDIGPYAYIRHPIYLGILIEEVALPLIANTFFSFFFVLLINIPLLLIRLMLEEKNSKRKFGENSYDNYRSVKPAFFPRSNRTNFFLNLLGILKK